MGRTEHWHEGSALLLALFGPGEPHNRGRKRERRSTSEANHGSGVVAVAFTLGFPQSGAARIRGSGARAAARRNPTSRLVRTIARGRRVGEKDEARSEGDR